jgi:ATP-dependent helicase/nuclease subunit B
VEKLFAPAATLRRPAAREPLWPMEIPLLPPPTGVSATAFGTYLNCPFRFYLSRVLKMDRFDPEKSELDALNFGDILHRAVETFARDPGVKDATDPAVIESCVLAAADHELRKACGTRLSLPVRVQRESLRARLRQFARIQADLRREGWVIEEAEYPFGEDEEILLGGLRLRSRIDRVDRHEKTGLRRVVDYKTYRSLAKNKPEDTHFGPPDGSLAEAETVWLGKPRRWAQLQLPVYRFLAMRRWPDDPAPPEVGYFVLPEKLDDSGVHLFALDEPLFESAMACATAVAERIRHGVFWPPREPKYDDFEALFPDGDPVDLVPPAVQSALRGP